jgi:hypothetical protein
VTELILDPDRPGLVRAVRQYDPHHPGRPLTECRMEYAAAADRWPPPARWELWHNTPHPRPEQLLLASRLEVQAWRRLDPPPADEGFTLSAFGLPEPATVELDHLPPTPGPELPVGGRWLWWAVGGIVAAGLVAFALVGRRAAAGGPA